MTRIYKWLFVGVLANLLFFTGVFAETLPTVGSCGELRDKVLTAPDFVRFLKDGNSSMPYYPTVNSDPDEFARPEPAMLLDKTFDGASVVISGNSVRIEQITNSGSVAEHILQFPGDPYFYATGVMVYGTKLVVVGSTTLPYTKLGLGTQPYPQGTPLQKIYIVEIIPPTSASTVYEMKILRSFSFEAGMGGIGVGVGVGEPPADSSSNTSPSGAPQGGIGGGGGGYGGPSEVRIVGNMLYVVFPYTFDYTQLAQFLPTGQREVVPLYFDSAHGMKEEAFAPCSSIAVLPGYEIPSYVMVASLNLDTLGEVQRSVVFGGDSSLYVGAKTLYIAQRTFSTSAPMEGVATKLFAFPLEQFLKANTTVQLKNSIGMSMPAMLHEEAGNLQVVQGITPYGSGTQTNASSMTAYIFSPTLTLLGTKENIIVGSPSASFLGTSMLLGTYWPGGPTGTQTGYYLLDAKDPQNLVLSANFAQPVPTYGMYPSDATPFPTPKPGIAEVFRDMQYSVPLGPNEMVVIGRDSSGMPMGEASGIGTGGGYPSPMKLTVIKFNGTGVPIISGEYGSSQKINENPTWDATAIYFDTSTRQLFLPVDSYATSGQPDFIGVEVFSIDTAGKISLKTKIANTSKDNQWESIIRIRKAASVSSSVLTYSYNSLMSWDSTTFAPLFTSPFYYNMTTTSTTTTTATATTRYDFSSGIDFAAGYMAQWVSQTQPKDTQFNTDNDEYFDVKPGDTVTVTAKFMNTGLNSWMRDSADREVAISIYKDLAVQSAPKNLGFDDPKQTNFGKSYFTSSNWTSEYRITTIAEDIVHPSETGTFTITFTVPIDAPLGKYREDITLSSGKYWMQNFMNGDPLHAAHIWIGVNVQ